MLVSIAVAQDAAEPATLEAKVDKIFQRFAKAEAPGAVVLVGRGANVVLQRAYGLADLERQVPLSVESVFDIGSTSKQFTAACVLLLELEQKLALGDLANKHVPELPACCDAVTVRHLMLHTSGIPDYIGLMATAGADLEDRTTADEAIAALEEVAALDFAAGSKWQYSNSNYFLLSEVVERTAKRSLAEFAHERLFEPLKLARTHIHTDSTQLVPHRALSYTKGARGRWRWNFSNWEQTGDGAVFTTVGDLFVWARNFHSGAVGGPALLAAMAAPGKLDDGSPLEYGAGLMFTKDNGIDVVSHGGAWAGYRAELLRVPSKELVVVCLCNRDDGNPSEMCRRVMRAALTE
jgi:CubicO group peptidase (beta-lactamase class C family)